MEAVLDIDHENYNERHALICMDESSKQVVADVEPAVPMAPGHPRREDHHYERKDVRALFMFFDPIRGWRRVSHRRSRTREDWAHEAKELIDVDYAHAEKITLVMDNLNTHDDRQFLCHIRRSHRPSAGPQTSHRSHSPQRKLVEHG